MVPSFYNTPLCTLPHPNLHQHLTRVSPTLPVIVPFHPARSPLVVICNLDLFRVDGCASASLMRVIKRGARCCAFRPLSPSALDPDQPIDTHRPIPLKFNDMQMREEHDKDSCPQVISYYA